MTGAEVIQFMMKKAASAPKGVDLIPGTIIRSLFQNSLWVLFFITKRVQTILVTKADSASKPNDHRTKGAKYTGKEHVWDEAFGYWGPAYTLTLTKES